MEFGVQNVNANPFSDNKCIETENAWFWEMWNLVSIWHENALFSALLCSVSEDCSETWPGCLNQVSGMSLRHSWNVEDPKPRFSQFWGKSCMQCWTDKCVWKWHWMSDACDSLLGSLSYCISISQPLYAMLIIALLHNHLNDSFTWFLTGTSLVHKRHFSQSNLARLTQNSASKFSFIAAASLIIPMKQHLWNTFISLV